jgi:flagellar biosynthesis/type III secretory pathway M-ring protein FliF/YscJ
MALRSMKGARATAGGLLSATPAPLQLPGERFDGGPATVEEPARTVRMLPELAAMQANQETKNRVANTVEQQPDVAAKLVRAWMKEA